MRSKITFQPEELHYLQLLAKQYPTVQAASTEIINLQAILNLPKGTEHFISDIHGEYEAFSHILNSCSGEVKQKLDERFSTRLSKHDRDELATLIYYPAEKLSLVTHSEEDMDEWYRISLHRLLEVCRWVSSKYTKVTDSAGSGTTAGGGSSSTSGSKVKVVGGDVTIRAKANKTSTKLGYIKSGNSATYLGKSSVDSRGIRWYYVEYKGTKGWVSSMYSKLV